MLTIQHQVSFFTPGAAYGNMGRVLSLLLEKSAAILDAPPTSIPVSSDAPTEIPRIILASALRDKQLTLSLERIDCAFIRPISNPITTQEITEFQEAVLQ
jgi:hypothetical protein